MLHLDDCNQRCPSLLGSSQGCPSKLGSNQSCPDKPAPESWPPEAIEAHAELISNIPEEYRQLRDKRRKEGYDIPIDGVYIKGYGVALNTQHLINTVSFLLDRMSAEADGDRWLPQAVAEEVIRGLMAACKLSEEKIQRPDTGKTGGTL